jgi:iron complex transport system substrate-binding protein
VAKFPQFEPALAEVTDVGIPFNFEALLAVNPDVILCRQTACDDSYDALSEIAPTIVFANESSADWQASARFFAQAINMTDAIDALEADYAERIDVFEATLVDAFGAASLTVSVLRVLPERLRLYFGESFAGVVLQNAGLQYPSAQQALAEESEFGSQLYQLSIEELPLIDADFVFVYVTDRLVEGQAEAYLEELQSDPLWQALPAVRNERLFVVGNYWFAAGYIAAHAIIDDLFAIVLNMEPPLANPFIAEAETRAE